MDFTLKKIKRLVRERRFRFSLKADLERLKDGLVEDEVAESILNADRIEKTIRSTSPRRKIGQEKLFVIHGPTDRGTWVYTKGTIRQFGNREEYYFLISSKMLD